jgi:hypothetical protein
MAHIGICKVCTRGGVCTGYAPGNLLVLIGQPNSFTVQSSEYLGYSIFFSNKFSFVLFSICSNIKMIPGIIYYLSSLLSPEDNMGLYFYNDAKFSDYLYVYVSTKNTKFGYIIS